MKPFDRNKYSDHSHALKSINSNYDLIAAILNRSGIDFAGKISSTLKNDEFYSLRDSVSLRLQSILFHYDLIASINISGREHPHINSPSPVYGGDVSLKQDFLFDSIVFNAMSFFDYLSCFISYIVFGVKKKQWTHLADNARANEKFKESELARTVDLLDRKLVTKLNKYRGSLIHYIDDYLPASQSFNVAKNTVIVSVIAPVRFRKMFKKELANTDNYTPDINTAALWIIDCITDGTLEIMKNLLNYIENNRKVPKGKEVIFFKGRGN